MNRNTGYFLLLHFIKLPRWITFAAAKIAQLQKIRVGIVNYLNTKPMIYGLKKMPISNKIELIEDHPARLAALLQEGSIDIGLVPVASLVHMDQYHFVSDYCIGTEGEIASVCLFSEVPVQEIKKVYLDYQSRSSVALLKWLIREYWGVQPELVHAEDESFRENITGTTAGLVIGDRAFEQRKISTFIYDLGSEWRSITGLPFVFAAWISRQPMSPEFIAEFNSANAEGMNHIDEIVASLNYPLFDLKKYYNLHVSYLLDERKRRGMEMFLGILREQ